MDATAAHGARTVFYEEPGDSWATPVATLTAREAATPVIDRLHPGVFGLFAGAYSAMLLVLWLLFATDVGAIFSIAVCTLYFAMYLGVPWVMNRLAREAEPQAVAGSLGKFFRRELVIYTGRLSGIGATVQMLLIPVSFTIAFVCFGVIIRITG